jgi:hypothetical protein
MGDQHAKVGNDAADQVRWQQRRCRTEQIKLLMLKGLNVTQGSAELETARVA